MRAVFLQDRSTRAASDVWNKDVSMNCNSQGPERQGEKRSDRRVTRDGSEERLLRKAVLKFPEGSRLS